MRLGQFLLFPAVGFVRDGDAVMLNVSWMTFGLVITLFRVERGDE